MKHVARLVTACLLACLMRPLTIHAGGDSAENPYEIAEKLFAKNHDKTALKYYQQALQQGEVRAHYRMGLIDEKAGRDRDALSHYRQFIGLAQPEDSQRTDAAQRVKAMEERLQRKTTRTTELLKRGKSLFRKGSYREAEKVLLRAVSEDPSNPEPHYSLGEVYMKLEEYGKAKTEYDRAKRSY